MLAVTTADNGFKILANANGLRSLRTVETPGFEALRSPIESAAVKVVIFSSLFLGFRYLDQSKFLYCPFGLWHLGIWLFCC